MNVVHFISQLNMVTIIALLALFSLTFYVSFTYINKDSNEEIDYKTYIYSTIISIIVTVISFYVYNTYKPKNSELLTGGFYN
jgi:heme/copper-type cytochrome/quinol oxidase subunit 4